MSALPPLTAIRAFEATARHLSFTRAGEELGMTQAAVSYQIKLLEERVGASLFLRRPRQIALTEAGARLAPEVTHAFETLRSAFADTRGRIDGTLSITSVPTFASHWLVQNLGYFQVDHPDLAVRLESTPGVVDFATEEFDVGLRGSNGVPRGLASHFLLSGDFTPMLSPSLAASIGGIQTPADLLRLPMVDADDPWFSMWFERAGVPDYSIEKRPISRLGAQNLEAAAAIAGRGVAMLTPAFYADDIAAGRLIQPFDILASDGHGYYLVYPEARRNSPKIRAFRDWLIPATAPLRGTMEAIRYPVQR
ncbi:LysR family transcriptional regulator [Devosia limi DSM 17137]|uniref:LysR family transcriptional regulator n=1 Tax=Devosia limi DSM 17137 TaxID=1121477 RepID=A0A0F5LWB6_9HYPH|nr:LysR substrate-binding domain-containing protein [Devosia limi]KKB86566.1 LysR family transcriptional regulator [Devosia limi DSM 17137]SHE53147.1 LysR family transcriptional regulator, glycine cleavage system transcriptional activator [Devosia limi DSM 17137]